MASYTITTVITAATRSDLTTLANVKADLAISDNSEDVFLKRAISKSSSAAASFCNRVFGVQTYQDLVRVKRDAYPFFPDDRQQPIMVARLPLVSVTSITEDGVLLVAGTDYEVDTENGYLYRLDSDATPTQWSALALVIVYQAGWILVGQANQTQPADIEDACIRMVKNARAMRTRESDLKVDDVAGISHREYWINASADGGNMTPDVADILNNYRVITFA